MEQKESRRGVKLYYAKGLASSAGVAACEFPPLAAPARWSIDVEAAIFAYKSEISKSMDKHG